MRASRPLFSVIPRVATVESTPAFSVFESWATLTSKTGVNECNGDLTSSKYGKPKLKFREGCSSYLQSSPWESPHYDCLLLRRSWRERQVHGFWPGWKLGAGTIARFARFWPVKLCTLLLIAVHLWNKRFKTQKRHAS